jgi:hypothetical protein
MEEVCSVLLSKRNRSRCNTVYLESESFILEVGRHREKVAYIF